MEARLVAARGGVTALEISDPKPETEARVEPSVEVAVAVPVSLANGTENGSINVWPDEAAEASFMAEARERGEPTGAIAPRPPAGDAADEVESAHLPSLDELVKRIPTEVRETLDDLFRAKFTTVRRLPKKSFNP